MSVLTPPTSGVLGETKDLTSEISYCFGFENGSPAWLIITHYNHGDNCGCTLSIQVPNDDPNLTFPFTFKPEVPLTVKETIVCTACGLSGKIENDTWMAV